MTLISTATSILALTDAAPSAISQGEERPALVSSVSPRRGLWPGLVQYTRTLERIKSLCLPAVNHRLSAKPRPIYRGRSVNRRLISSGTDRSRLRKAVLTRSDTRCAASSIRATPPRKSSTWMYSASMRPSGAPLW